MSICKAMKRQCKRNIDLHVHFEADKMSQYMTGWDRSFNRFQLALKCYAQLWLPFYHEIFVSSYLIISGNVPSSQPDSSYIPSLA